MAEIKMSMRAARVNAGLTQTDIAKAVGVNVSTVVSWEKGYSIPFADKFKRFCEMCNVPMDSVLLPNDPT